MTVALTNWDRFILPSVPFAPDVAIQAAALDAAIDFCEGTLIWKEWLDRISIVADDEDYSLVVPAALSTYAEIEKVYQVFYKEAGADDDQFAPLDPTTEDELEATLGGAWMFNEATQPSKYFMSPSDPNTLILYCIPTVASASGLLVRVYCKPLSTATVLPDFLWVDHKHAIKHGALSFFFGQKGMPWYDPKEEAKHYGLFQNEKDNAIFKAVNGPVRREMRVRMRDWI